MTNPPADADPGNQPGATLRWQVGEVTIVRVGELIVPTAVSHLLPAITPAMLDAHASWIEPFFERGHLRLSFHTFVVVCPTATVVVDTCLGDDPVRMVPGDPSFPDRLGAVIDGGLDAVDAVLCTHLHFDHVGWNTRVVDGERVPTFPNARYLFGRDEVDHLAGHDDHDVAADVVPLIDAGLVDLIDTDHRLAPEISVFPTPGHTPGHVSVSIESGGSRAIITGDAVHSPIQFPHPEVAATPFDWDSELSTSTRRRLVESLIDTDVLILGTHFAPPTAGYLRSGHNGPWLES